MRAGGVGRLAVMVNRRVILDVVSRRTEPVAFAELLQLGTIAPSLSQTLRRLARRGDIVLLNKHRRPLDMTGRHCCRFVTTP